ncbi:MAG: hypothetical protein IKQ90_00955 [Ruminococcus sp.]|nr:hypothetical protein [Ruminococcus sp.]
MKKLLSMMSALALIISAAACSDKKSESSAPASKNVTVTQTMYKEQRLSLPDDFSSYEAVTGVSGGASYIYTNDSGELCSVLIGENGDISGKTVYSGIPAYIERFVRAEADGTVLVLTVSSEEDASDYESYEEFYENAKLDYDLFVFSSSGELTEKIRLEGFDRYMEFGEAFINCIFRFGGGFLISTNKGTFIADSGGNITDAYESENSVLYGKDTGGKLFSCDMKGYCEYVPGRSSDMTEYGKYLSRMNAPFTGTGDYRIFFMLNEGIFGLTDSGQFLQLIDYTDSNILPSEVYGIAPVSEGQFLMSGCSVSGGFYLSFLTVRPDDYVENKLKVVLGCGMDSIGTNEREWAAQYNKQSDLYSVELKAFDFADEDLKMAVLAGDPPDVYCYHDNSAMYRYTNMGAFENMYDLMDKYGGFTQDDILPNIIEGMEYKGGLYSISPRFGISAMVADSSMISPELSHWTYDEFYSIAENMPEGMYLGNQMTFINGRSDVFGYLAKWNLNSWIDYDRYTCNFDSPEFVHLLEFCRDVPMLPERDWTDFYSSTTEDEQRIDQKENDLMLKEKKALLADTYAIGSFSQFLSVMQKYGYIGGGMTLLTPPSDSREGIFNVSNFDHFSVVRGGNCTEGGWDFVNYIMSCDFQTTDLQMKDAFTTRKDSFEWKKNQFLKNYRYIRFYKNGGMSTLPEVPDKDTEDDSFGEYTELILDEKTVDEYAGLLLSCTVSLDTSSDVSDILDEEFSRFINGELSAEECAAVIQDRVSIYLSEQS